ncbi:5,10-methylenetetrahydrofolate reductase [Alphaproteobacteria bacterium]|jgi:methylenetetrahydrofolate reductase (NADPH)|nr:5,10-methylenetetrahydrofolate reductase [Alphaproteobacteria bacterium]|tara:strand:+ start:152 stop:1042 length:891 start_codon:yes stop_codon:yes gene_type:complete
MKSKLRNSLQENKFVFTAETSPPDSGNKEVIIKQVECLKYLADAVNVTDGAGAKSHMSALATAVILAQNSIEPVLQFTTRDRNRIAIQGDLLGGWALNVPNILCLYGDEVKGGDQPETREVRDLDTISLLKTAHDIKINKTYPSGRKIEDAPEFFIGGADTPFEVKDDFDGANLIKKINAGVEFFQTQYAFDEVVLKNYMMKLNKLGITDKAYFIIGLGVIRSAKSARWMNKNLFGINIPEKIITRIENSNDEKIEGIKICIELIEKYKLISGVSGVHLMGYKQEQDIASVISNFI